MSSDEQVLEEEAGKPNLVSLLKQFEGAPTEETIEKWKQQYGEVFVSGFSEEELYIFRPLSWKEHKNLNKELSVPAEQGEDPKTELDLQEKVVDLCLLWSSVENYELKGGTIPTLFEMVMLNSNFVNPQLAMSFVAKL